MALLAKYYLTYNSPMDMGGNSDTLRRRTHLDNGWRPPMLSPNAHNGATSAPNTPHLSRKGAFYRGHRGSCDYGESIAQKPKLDSAKFSSSFVRRFSARNRSRGASSAPTSPRFGIDARCNSDPNEGKFTLNSTDECSSPISPLCNDAVDHGHTAKFSPPNKHDLASRRSRYAMDKFQHQTYGGVTTGFSFSSSTTSSPPSSAGSPDRRRAGEHSGCSVMRRRCSSGPLNEEEKLRKGQVTPKKPELLLTVSYSKNASFMTATINRARNLSVNSGAFVRVHLYDGFKPISLKQTSIAQGGPNVEFKQAFMFSLGKDTLWAAHILVELYEYDVIGNECKYGDVVIGPKANGNGLSQWRQVCTHPNTPCSMWHAII